MAMIRTTAAARMLGVSTNTLRSWERRYGFPQPLRSQGGHRQYDFEEIAALRQTLAETHNVSSAIALVQERGAGPPSSAQLATAYQQLDDRQADRLLEESLVVRSLERTIDEVLLPGVESCADPADQTAEYEFAWRHAVSWLAAIGRLSHASARSETILLIDPSVPCDLDGLQTRALEVILRATGLRTVTLTPAIQRSRLRRALRALAPQAVVVCGERASLDTIARLVFAARTMGGRTHVFDYRVPVPETRGSGLSHLGDSPVAAKEDLLAALDAGRAGVPSLR